MALTEAITSFRRTDLNGLLEWGTKGGYSRTSVPIPSDRITDEDRETIINSILDSQYLGFYKGDAFGTFLGIKKPEQFNEIIEFIKEIKDFYTYMATSGIGERNPTFFSALSNLWKAVENAGGEGGSILDLSEAIDEYNKKLQEMEDEEETVTESLENTTDAIEDQAKSAKTLADSIDDATKAKEAFDDAMKTTKADAMNGYITAFQTLQDEINAGRVNSTAFYASARMLLGDAAYNATGGTSEGVMAALNRRGSSGSLSEAGKILNQTYYDENGNEIEGYGLYQLLTQTKGFRQGWLTSAEGNAYIPELTKQDIDKISAAWGGLSTELIVAFFEAFDQYDIKGEATDAAVQVKKKETEQDQTQKAAPELPARVTEKQNELADAEEKLAASAEKATETIKEATEELKAASEETESPKEVNPDVQPAMNTAQEWLELLTAIEEAYGRINTQTVGYSPDLEKLFEDVDKLREDITLNVKPGEKTGTASLMASVLSAAISTIEGYANDGIITAEMAASLTGDLYQGLLDIINNAKTIDELEEITLGITGDDKPLNRKIAAALLRRRKEIELNVDAKTEQAEKDLTDLENGPYNADIRVHVNEDDKRKVEEEIQELQKKWEESGLPYSDEPFPQTYFETFFENPNDPENSPFYQIHYIKREGSKDDYDVESMDTPWGTFDSESGVDLERYAKAIRDFSAAYEEAGSLAYDYADVDFAILEDVKDAYMKSGGNLETTAEIAGYSIDRIIKAYSRLYHGISEDSDGFDERLEKLNEFLTTWAEMEFPDGLPDFELDVDTDNAEEEIQNIEDENYEATIQVEQEGAENVDEILDDVSRDRFVHLTVLYRNGNILRLANGTNEHPGGLSLVNDGSGPELIVDRGSAFIAGGGKPTIVSLEKGAKVFTASETRSILNRSGIPAYAKGTLPEMVDISGSSVSVGGTKKANYTITNSAEANFGKVSTTKPEDSSSKSSGSDSSGGSSGKEETIKFDDLKSAIDYIINRIGEGLDEQLEILDKQIEELKLQRQAAEQQNELEEKQKAVAEAQKDLQTALSERTIRYLGEDGKWHWMADARNVQSAQESLQKAQDELSKYQEELAYDAQVNALEEQKKALQAEYKSITEAWSKIQSGVSTPTGVISEMISAIMAGGTPQEQTGAKAIRDYLIGELLTGGSYSGNYNEALDSIAKATAGTPIMPGDDNPSLASLIATGGGLTGNVADALKYGATGTTASMIGASGLTGTNINYNYFVNGMEIGSDSAKTMTLSEIMQKLTVYAGQ